MKSDKGFISQDALKITALLSMLIDHIGATLIKDRYDRIAAAVSDHSRVVNAYRLYCVFRVLGRAAFPIFAFLLVQGFYKTHSRVRYLLTMAAFALISELPYDLAFNDRFRTHPFDEQNVFVTLTLGLLMLILTDKLINLEKVRTNETLRFLISVLVLALFCIIARFSNCDYSYRGILMIYIIWALFEKRLAMCLLAPAVYCLLNLIPRYMGTKTVMVRQFIICQIIMYFLTFALIYFSNGIRRIRGRIKYAFYAFYPLHIALLCLIRKIFYA